MNPRAAIHHSGNQESFGSTTWSLVFAAGEEGEPTLALDRLIRIYWRPIYIFVRRSGSGPEEAEDVTQDFFIYLLDREWIKKADPKKGSFRGFLLALLRNFLANHRRKKTAQKRLTLQRAISIDGARCEGELTALASAEVDAAVAYDRVWAHTLLQTALNRLADEQAAQGNLPRFSALRPFLRQAAVAGDYVNLGAQLGLSRGQVALLIHRLSRRFAELIRIELAETLLERRAVEDELRHLLQSLET